MIFPLEGLCRPQWIRMSNKGGIKGKLLLQFSVVDLKHRLPPIWNHVRSANWNSFTCNLGLFHQFWGNINQRETTQTSISQLESSPRVNTKNMLEHRAHYIALTNLNYQGEIPEELTIHLHCLIPFMIPVKTQHPGILECTRNSFLSTSPCSGLFFRYILGIWTVSSMHNYELGWWLKA